MDETDIVLTVDGHEVIIGLTHPTNKIDISVIKEAINMSVNHLKEEGTIPVNNRVTKATSLSFIKLDSNTNLVNVIDSELIMAEDIIQIKVTTSPVGGRRKRKTRKNKRV